MEGEICGVKIPISLLNIEFDIFTSFNDFKIQFYKVYLIVSGYACIIVVTFVKEKF